MASSEFLSTQKNKLQLDKLASFSLLYLRQTQRNPNFLLQDTSSKPGKYLKTSQDSPTTEAGALPDIMMEREWRCDKDSKEEYMQVMDKFMDIKSAQYSNHQISFMGECLDKKPVGTWFNPNTMA